MQEESKTRICSWLPGFLKIFPNSTENRLIALLILFGSMANPVSAEIRVVTTLPVLADIARSVGGNYVTVQSLAKGTEDPHYVIPRPSLMAAVSDADLFIEVGMDLELWTERVLEGAGNDKVQPGRPGHVYASDGVQRLEVPDRLTRAEGDIHPFGNPHQWMNPLNGILFAGNIARGLQRVDPAHSAEYDSNLAGFRANLYVKLFGDDLVKTYGGEQLAEKLRRGILFDFLQSEKVDAKLGGWMGQARILRGTKVVTYHKAWSYLAQAFDMDVINTVEEKPGIPPSAEHRDKLLGQIKETHVRILIMAPFEPRRIPDQIAALTGARVVVLPLDVTGVLAATNYFSMFDVILKELARAGSDTAPATPAPK